jgi:hypothetical protein
VVLVDEPTAKIRSPGAHHPVVRLVEEEDPDAGEADPLARELHRPAQDGVGVVERQDLVEGRQQRRQLPVDRPARDRRNGNRMA